ncbi:MAG: hypothetical protein ISS16_11690 [Ignavibacteria bacterium]|nr:hypothetical protein [Ignavibacteria bacterium]
MEKIPSRRIFRALRELNDKEFKEFGKFISSPYHNSNKNLITYYNFLERYHPKFKEVKTTHERIYAALFPGKKFNYGILRNLNSEMVTLFKEFLAYSNYKKKTIQVDCNLLEELRKRKLESLFNREFKSTFEKIDSMQTRDEDYYLNKFSLESELNKYFDEKLTIGTALTFYKGKINEINDLTNYFIIAIFKEYIIQISGGGKIDFEKSLILHDELLSYISSNLDYYKQIDIIYLLYNFLVLLKESENEDVYNNLKKILKEKRHTINDYDIKTFYVELYNYCKRKQSEGSKKYGLESFEMLKNMIELGVFFNENGNMSDHNYINIAASAFRINESNWAENFIKVYKEKLPFEKREIAFNYNNAVLNFRKGKDSPDRDVYYEKALGFLSEINVDNFYYMTRVKNLSLQIYYELNEIDLALGMINTYKHYLSRDIVMPKNLKLSYLNYIHYVSKLIKIKTGSKIIHTTRIKKEISRNENMAYKGWLLERIKELEMKELS